MTQPTEIKRGILFFSESSSSLRIKVEERLLREFGEKFDFEELIESDYNCLMADQDYRPLEMIPYIIDLESNNLFWVSEEEVYKIDFQKIEENTEVIFSTSSHPRGKKRWARHIRPVF